MKFLIDAQLPRRLCKYLQEIGYDALHTLDLPEGNRTTDGYINRFSIQEERIVITKDADFVNSMILQAKPYKLLLISTGNIGNKELLNLIQAHSDTITSLFDEYTFVELNRDALNIHF